ncbi:MAG: hypothetical protein JWM85_1686 [Acidimicrobiaceae bacterium]|nr:hypothetical protein [Acidimicrobiaceae bacterium]
MPRTRYTKIVHQEQRIQLARQEKALFALARELRREITEPSPAPITDSGKQHRHARLAQKHRHTTAKRQVATASTVQTASVPVKVAA